MTMRMSSNQCMRPTACSQPASLPYSLSPHRLTTDRPLSFAPCHFSHTGLVVHRFRPEPHLVGAGATNSVHGIGFDELGPVFFRVGDGCLEKLPRHAPAAVLTGHDKADHRPDGLVI